MKNLVKKVSSIFRKEVQPEVIRYRITVNSGYLSIYGPDCDCDTFVKL